MDRGQRPAGACAICACSAKSLRRLRKTAVEMDLEERMHLPGLDPRRADLMVAGAILLDTLLKKLGAEEITLCDLALREGVLLDYIHAHRKDIARVDSYPDVRRRSVIELAERCAWEADHSQAGRGDRADAVRLHQADSRARRSRARVARVRRASSTTSAITSATRSIIATRTT